MNRVTYNMTLQRNLIDQRRNLYNLSEIMSDLSSGKTIRRPSDDPIKTSRAMRLNTELRVNELYKQNLDMSTSWTKKSNDSMTNLQKIILRMKHLLNQSANTANDVKDKKLIAAELAQLKEAAITIANDDMMGRHQFSGHKTDLKMVMEDGSYNKVLDLAGLKYEDIDQIIGVSQKTKINHTGVDAFGHEYYHTNTRADKDVPFFDNKPQTMLSGKMDITIQLYDELYSGTAREARPAEYEKDQVLEDIKGPKITFENVNYYANYDKDDINTIIEDMNKSLRSRIREYVDKEIPYKANDNENLKLREQRYTELKNAVQFVNDNGKIAFVTDNNYGLNKIETSPLVPAEFRATPPLAKSAPSGSNKVELTTEIAYKDQNGYKEAIDAVFAFDLNFSTYRKDENGDLVDKDGNLVPDGNTGTVENTHSPDPSNPIKITFAKTYYRNGLTDFYVGDKIAADLQYEIDRQIDAYNKTSLNKIPKGAVKVSVDKETNQPTIYVDKYDGITITNKPNYFQELASAGGGSKPQPNEDVSKNTSKPPITVYDLGTVNLDPTKDKLINVNIGVEFTTYPLAGRVDGDVLYLGDKSAKISKLPANGAAGEISNVFEGTSVGSLKSILKDKFANYKIEVVDDKGKVQDDGLILTKDNVQKNKLRVKVVEDLTANPGTLYAGDYSIAVNPNTNGFDVKNISKGSTVGTVIDNVSKKLPNYTVEIVDKNDKPVPPETLLTSDNIGDYRLKTTPKPISPADTDVLYSGEDPLKIEGDTVKGISEGMTAGAIAKMLQDQFPGRQISIVDSTGKTVDSGTRITRDNRTGMQIVVAEQKVSDATGDVLYAGDFSIDTDGNQINNVFSGTTVGALISKLREKFPNGDIEVISNNQALPAGTRLEAGGQYYVSVGTGDKVGAGGDLLYVGGEVKDPADPNSGTGGYTPPQNQNFTINFFNPNNAPGGSTTLPAQNLNIEFLGEDKNNPLPPQPKAPTYGDLSLITVNLDINKQAVDMQGDYELDLIPRPLPGMIQKLDLTKPGDEKFTIEFKKELNTNNKDAVLRDVRAEIETQVISHLNRINKERQEARLSGNTDPNKDYSPISVDDIEVVITEDNKIQLIFDKNMKADVAVKPVYELNTFDETPREAKAEQTNKIKLDLFEYNTNNDGFKAEKDNQVYMDLNFKITEYERDQFGDPIPKKDANGNPIPGEFITKEPSIFLDEITLNKTYTKMKPNYDPEKSLEENQYTDQEIRDQIAADVQAAIDAKVKSLNPSLPKNSIIVRWDDKGDTDISNDELYLDVSPEIQLEVTNDKMDDIVSGNPQLFDDPTYAPEFIPATKQVTITNPDGTTTTKTVEEYKKPEREMMSFFEMVDRMIYMCNNNDTVGLSRMHEVLNWHEENNLKMQGEGGGRLQMYEIMTSRNANLNDNFRELLSQTWDTDYAEASAQMSIYWQTYRATLAMTGRIMTPSLVDFLR